MVAELVFIGSEMILVSNEVREQGKIERFVGEHPVRPGTIRCWSRRIRLLPARLFLLPLPLALLSLLQHLRLSHLPHLRLLLPQPPHRASFFRLDIGVVVNLMPASAQLKIEMHLTVLLPGQGPADVGSPYA